MSNNSFISWRRVSTKKQGRSGLGLEAQADIIRYFVERSGGTLIADYCEVYTGKELSGCTELRKAIAHCKKVGATLIIAKTDRFRNVTEALTILDEMGEGKIEFCDLPHSDRFTLTLFFALAEREALLVSIRTRQALAVKKAQGCKLGAGADSYRASMANKTAAQLQEIADRRGATKRARFWETKDVQAFLRVLRLVFGLSGEPQNWPWKTITTKEPYKERIKVLMQNYRDLDQTLFVGWDFIDCERFQQKLSNTIATIKRSLRV